MVARLVVVVVAVVLTGSWALAQGLPKSPQDGKGLYQRHCAGCHGSSGDGLGPDIKELIVPPASFLSDRMRIKTDMELYLAIKQGVLFSPMHGWADRLSDQEIRDVLHYIRSLAPFNPLG